MIICSLYIVYIVYVLVVEISVIQSDVSSLINWQGSIRTPTPPSHLCSHSCTHTPTPHPPWKQMAHRCCTVGVSGSQYVPNNFICFTYYSCTMGHFVMHILDHHWLKKWLVAFSLPNQWRFIANWAYINKLPMKFERKCTRFSYGKCWEQSRNPYDVNLLKHTDEIAVVC